MSFAPTVSIIIPTCNRMKLLEATISSVQQQSFEDWELYVIDDCATEGTYDYLATLSDKRIKPIKLTENSERSKARNLGLAKIGGKYVLFLDDDDLLTKNALALQVDSLDTSEDAVASIGSYLMFDDTGEAEVKEFPIVKKWHVINIYNDLLFGWMATAGHTLFRASTMKNSGGWNEAISFAEDHELWLRIGCDAKVALIPQMVLEYRVHGQWRPDNQQQIMTDLRMEAIERLEKNKQKRALGIMRARAVLAEAESLYQDANAFAALKKYLFMAWHAPSLLFSPLSSPVTLKPLITCFLGGAGIRFGRILASKLR